MESLKKWTGKIIDTRSNWLGGRYMNTLRVIGISLLLASSGVTAQESDGWGWKIAPYLWGLISTVPCPSAN
jgi:hypothetical protein